MSSTPSRIRNFPLVSGVNIAGTLVPISDKIVTLGVTLDRHLALKPISHHRLRPDKTVLSGRSRWCEMGFSHHTSNVCTAAYFHIRALHHIRPSLTEGMAITVDGSMLHSCLDYANSLVHGHIKVKRLQSVQNSAVIWRSLTQTALVTCSVQN